MTGEFAKAVYGAQAMGPQSILEAGEQFLEKPFTAEPLLACVRDGLLAKRDASQPRYA